MSDRLAAEIPGAFKPNQYFNPNGPLSHYETTGPEIWRDTDGRITHLVAGVGTGGTISGTGRFLKEVSEGRVRMIGADPEGSVYSGGTGRPYLVEGVGEDFWPGAYDPSVVDEVIAVSRCGLLPHDPAARPRGGHPRRRVERHGRRRGTAGRERPRPPTTSWSSSCPTAAAATWRRSSTTSGCGPTASATCPTSRRCTTSIKTKRGDLPDLVHAHPSDTVRDAIQIMNTYGVSQLPVLTAEPPVVMGEVAGALDETLPGRRGVQRARRDERHRRRAPRRAAAD